MSFYPCVPQITIIWCMVPEIYGEEFFLSLGYFLSFYPTNNLKNQNFEKMKKTPRDIIILHLCTTNDNHMKYGSWDMEPHRQKLLSLTTQKIKLLKKERKTAWRYYHFTHVYHKWRSYDVLFLRYGVWRRELFLILDHFLPFYPPNSQENHNFE